MLRTPDPAARLRFANWWTAQDAQNPDFAENIWYSDEAVVQLSGQLHSQNSRYWAEQAPAHFTSTSALHPPQLNMWIAISSNGIIGPYFFMGPNHQYLTTDAARYERMLKSFFVPELYNLCTLQNLDPFLQWYMHDGASAHYALGPRQYLSSVFGCAGPAGYSTVERTVGRGLAQPWPARSPDATPCDFFVWGYLKDKLKLNSPYPDLATLEREVRQLVRGIPQQMSYDACIHQMSKRVQLLIQHQGGTIENHM